MKNMRLGTQISLGFAAILLLLIVISTAAYIGLSTSVRGFNDYREMARQSNLAGRIQANMMYARFFGKVYLQTESDDAVAKFKERFAKMEEFVGEAKRDITAPERAKHMALIEQEVTKYDKAFDQVVNFMTERNQVVKGRLDPNGATAAEEIDQIMESAYRDGDAETAFYAARLMESMLLTRIYAIKYLNTNRQADADVAHKHIDEEVSRRMADLDQRLDNPTRRAHLAKFKEAVANYASALDDINRIVNERNAVINDEMDRIGPVVADAVEQVKLSIQAEQDKLGPQIKHHNETTTTTVIWLSIGSLLLGVALSWLLVRVIKRPLGGEPSEMERIARTLADGDLRIHFDDTRQATGVYAAMRDMVEKLREIVIHVRGATDEVANGSGEIAQGNSDLSQRTEEQASSLEETASSMEQLTSTVKQNADNARQANQLASGARNEAERGGEVVSQAVTAMAEINASSKKIADIIGVIDEIAFQTNLLALNAAVEAARAGEQGRGFAVVAQEVRKLAQRSADSAKEISELIKDSVAKVDEGSKLVDASGSALHEILQAVKNVTDVVSEIAAASAEQTTGIEQVNKAIMQMDEVTQQNAALVEEAAAASKSLEDQAAGLREAIGFFKVDGGHESATPRRAKPKPPALRPAAASPKPTKKLAAPSSPAKRHPAPAADSNDEWEEF
ncbi:methyl-accepting chemotaxis protein [Endothiovibrio diazotrophicus]